MIRLYPPIDAYQAQNLDDIFARAIEGDAYHAAIEVAQADVSVVLASGNVSQDTPVSFAKPFAAAPLVVVTVTSAANAGVYINAFPVSVTTTGFKIRAASGAAQTITFKWLAYGRRE